MKRERILLVEDDLRLAEMTADYLRQHEFDVAIEGDGGRAAERIEREQPDLVLLDVNLPNEDGFSICRRVRARYRGPIVMLTARSDEVDQIVGLELGATDYLLKPVSPRVLVARLRAMLRRAGSSDSRMVFGSLVVDGSTREVTSNGAPVLLTTAEFDLLWLLASHAGSILDRDALLGSLRGIGYDGLDRSIDVRISKLRKKIGDDPKTPHMIKTVRGSGYLFARRTDV